MNGAAHSRYLGDKRDNGNEISIVRAEDEIDSLHELSVGRGRSMPNFLERAAHQRGPAAIARWYTSR
jgi:hypothetical protein